MCNCIDETNKALEKIEGNNTKLDIPIVLRDGITLDVSRMVLIATVKRDDSKRKKPSKLFASYCPFCGEKYENGHA